MGRVAAAPAQRATLSSAPAVAALRAARHCDPTRSRTAASGTIATT